MNTAPGQLQRPLIPLEAQQIMRWKAALTALRTAVQDAVKEVYTGPMKETEDAMMAEAEMLAIIEGWMAHTVELRG